MPNLTKKPINLSGRSLIRVSGAAAAEFLNATITANISALKPSALHPAALLSPQGKILFDFLITRLSADKSEDFLIDIAAASAEAFARRLSLYKLRRPIELSAPEPIAAHISDTETEGARRDMRFPDYFPIWRSYQSAAAETASAQAEWDALRLAYAVPEGGRDFTLGDAFPHDVNYDALGAVSFRKGCYIGQEIVSRMQHKAVIRKRLVKAEAAETGAALPAAGTEITANGKILGLLGTVSGGQALALIRTDRLAAANGAAEAAGTALRFIAPLYLPAALKDETERKS